MGFNHAFYTLYGYYEKYRAINMEKKNLHCTIKGPQFSHHVIKGPQIFHCVEGPNIPIVSSRSPQIESLHFWLARYKIFLHKRGCPFATLTTAPQDNHLEPCKSLTQVSHVCALDLLFFIHICTHNCV